MQSALFTALLLILFTAWVSASEVQVLSCLVLFCFVFFVLSFLSCLVLFYSVLFCSVFSCLFLFCLLFFVLSCLVTACVCGEKGGGGEWGHFHDLPIWLKLCIGLSLIFRMLPDWPWWRSEDFSRRYPFVLSCHVMSRLVLSFVLSCHFPWSSAPHLPLFVRWLQWLQWQMQLLGVGTSMFGRGGESGESKRGWSEK